MEEVLSEGPRGIHVRTATADDRGFVLGIVPRFAEFGLPPRHDPGQVLPAVGRSLDALASPGGDAAVLVVESDEGRMGFVHVKAENDYFSGEPRAYVFEWPSRQRRRDGARGGR